MNSNRPLAPGAQFPATRLTDMRGSVVQIPDPDGRITHLQFRRFAGCPICNLHLRSITGRLGEIEAAGVREVVVFHSTDAELLTYQDDLPLTVVGDPGRTLYRRFGVESGPRAFGGRAWRALPRGLALMARQALTHRRVALPVAPTGGKLGLPADVLVAADGRVIAARYGEHADDQWSVDELLALVVGDVAARRP